MKAVLEQYLAGLSIAPRQRRALVDWLSSRPAVLASVDRIVTSRAIRLVYTVNCINRAWNARQAHERLEKRQ